MKGTKKSFFTSLLSLILCFSMLLGTTYAWFTDSATSAGNKVQAGNLDVELRFWTSATDFEEINEEADPIFGVGNSDTLSANADSRNTIWEPGKTQTVFLSVKNAGSLDLKYKVAIEAYNVIGNLISVMQYQITPDAKFDDNVTWKSGTTAKEGYNNTSAQNVSLKAGEEHFFALSIHMDEEAGNSYMAGSVDFDIRVLASQLASESDSLGNKYDEGAEWPDVDFGDESSAVAPVTPTADGKSSETVNMTSADGKTSATVPAGTKLDNGANKLTLKVTDVAESKANITLAETEASASVDVHIEGVAEENDVVIAVAIKGLLPKGLNMGNYRLYHVENGATVAMTLLAAGATPVHNNFEYDPATGDTVLYLKSFSEVAVVADTENAWEGTVATSFAGGNGTAESPFLIANADQLAYFGDRISNDNANYGDKCYKLISDINLGGEENAANGIIFYPIGYNKIGGDTSTVHVDVAPESIYIEENQKDPADDSYDGGYSKGSSVSLFENTNVWYTYGGAFKGTFDGNGNTIKNIYQNTWQMKGDYEGSKHYWNAAMGIFGYVYGGTVKNLTVDNFTSDGEFTPTGVIAAYAANATFENIAIKNCNPRVYNTGNGGIVGIGGNSSDTTAQKLTFANITVDNSNKISALWGSWDVACGGIMGMFRGNGLVHFENCNIGAQIDVYNDVCGNYQYYWYRYSGMLIGSIRGKNIVVNGYTVPNTTGITAANSTVHFGDWNDYYYCELVANSLASYTHDHQFSRLTVINSLDDIKSGDEWTKAGNFLLIEGNVKTCYHIVDNDGVLTRHFHEDAGTEVVNDETVLKEDKQVVYLPFNQLIQGDGWGVKTIGFRNDSELDFDGITILDRVEANSIDKFEANVNGVTYEEGTTVTIGDLFNAINGVSINGSTLMVFVSPVGEGSTAGAIYTPNTTDWTKGTLTFTGTGAAKIVITDYTYCKEAVANVIIGAHEHVYDDACDTTCNKCGEERTIEHAWVAGTKVDPTCEAKGYTNYTCACGATKKDDFKDALGHTYNAVVTDPDCENGGYTTYTCDCGHSYVADEVAATGHDYEAVVTAPTCTTAGYTTYTCACGDSYVSDNVDATGHNMVTDEAVAPDCENTGLTEGSHCTKCDYKIPQQVVGAVGHNYNAVVTAPTCTTVGYTTYTCACGHSYVADEVAATGHDYEAVVTAPTCTTAGYTTYTCACGDSYVSDNVDATGHNMVTDEAVAPDCENTGLTEGSHCTKCDYKIPQQVVGAVGHNYNAVVTAPTCTTAGYTTYTCACGDTYVADEVGALGHDYEVVVTAPDCENGGYTTYTCDCGHSYVADEVAAKGHNMVIDEAVEPDCENTGLTEGSHCTRCDYKIPQQVVGALGHDYEAVVTAPTCTTAGYTTYTCGCGHSYKANETAALGHTAGAEANCTTAQKCTVCGTELVAAKGHSYNAEVTAPTCTSKGYTTYTCACGDTYTADETAALGHTAGAEATCTTAQICTVCGTELVAAKGHSYNAVVTAPTCTTKGYTTYTCACGDTYTADETAKTNHSYDAVVTAPTCTTAGYTTYTCACGDTYTADEVAAKGHSYNAEVTAPTCTTKGYTTYTCACGDTYTADETAALGHTAGAEATCTTAQKCTVCGTELVAAKGHSYNAVVTAPTCTTAGYTTYTCACGDTYTADETAKTNHSYNAVVTAPTCTTVGYTTYTCACGDSYVSDNVDATGHNMVTDEAVEPDCENTGLTEGSHCSVCNEVIVAQKTVDALGHTEVVDDAVAPTCTATGLTEGKHCSVCNEVLVAQTTVAAKGHAYNEGKVTTAPTCEGKGVKTFTCANDASHTYTEEVDALGHKEETVVGKAATCTEKGLTDGKKCSVCQTVTKTQTEISAKGHAYNEDEITTAPTCEGKGVKTFTCANDASHTYTEEINALGHAFETKFTGDFLYRVGNGNAVSLGSLFDSKRDVVSGNVTVTITKSKGTATGTYTHNASDWTKGTIKFSGTGIVEVKISINNCTCVTLELEVVNAVNATSATSAKSNNVVLLNDVGISTLEVSGGYTLYGNGFKMTATTDPMYDTMRAGFVTLDNGTLDNVQIICPNFSYAIIYNSQIKSNDNTAKPSDSSNDARGNVRSAVMATGNSKIVNSYIHGGRAAIFLRSGNLLVDGSTISGGAAANIHALSAQSLTLRNATLIQKPFKDNVHNTGNTLMGFSVLLECGEDGNSTPVILEGTLIQDAWINEDYVKYTPSKASSIVEIALSKSEYLHDLDGDGKNESLNLGFTYIPQETSGETNANVTDNRTNKDSVPYAAVDVGASFAKAKVYSYKNTNGTSDEFTVEGDYVASAQGATAPTVSFTDTNDDRVFETKFDANDGRWESTLTVNLDKGNYTFSWDKLLAQKHGAELSYTVIANGSTIDTSKAIALTATGMTEYVLTVTDGEVTHTVYFIITASKTSIPDPVTSDTTGGTPLLVVKSKNSDWTVGIPALEGMKIKYYTADGEVILDLATLTPTSTGKQNGTNNYWETTKDGYKLKVTCGVIHDTKSVYGMPVVVDNNGTKQMYFTISSTNGYVSTGTSARAVTITYEFTDPNGKTLTFTKSWIVNYADYKDKAQYSYSDFVNGKMTDLLTSSSGGGTGTCVTPDTLITLADGTQVRVDSLTGNEELLVWNMETGKLDKASIMFVDSDPEAEYQVIKLYFSDGTEVRVIYEHGFWDYDLNKYVYLDANAAEYIGHTFAKQSGDSLEKVQLVDVVIETELTTAWSPVTAGHLCYFVNGMLSMPGGVGGLFNIFEVDSETMTYDYEQLEKDIETYGLYTYEELNALCPLSEKMFVEAGGAYLKISIGKGNMTEQELYDMINRYSKFFE